MTSPEFTQQPDILAAYHAVDDAIPVGRIPLSVCRDIRAAAGDPAELTPNQRYEYAWVGLEETLAMAHEPDPETGKKYTPRKQNMAAAAVRQEFQALFDDASLPLALRTRAGITLAGIGIQQEVNTVKKGDRPSPEWRNYLTGIKRAARQLAEQGATNDEEHALIDQITSLAILSEYTQQAARFTLASPRQPWHINGFSRDTMSRVRMVVAPEAPDKHTIFIDPKALGDTLWTPDESYEHGSTLREYLTLPAGLGAIPISHGSSDTIKLFSGLYYDRHQFYLERQAFIKPPPFEAALGRLALGGIELLQAENTQSEAVKEFAEIDWYLEQDSYDTGTIPVKLLATNVEKLERAQARGELQPGQLHTLAWMQTDLASLRMPEVWSMRDRAAETLARAETAGPKERRAMLAAVKGLQENADAIEAEAGTLFDRAAANMEIAQTATVHPADQLEIAIDAGALPVYRTLYMNADPTALAQSARSYLEYLADLEPKLRDANRRMGHDEDEQIAVQAAAVRATIMLLIGDSSDPAARHLVLPPSVRSGGEYGPAEAIVSPYNSVTNSYDFSSWVLLGTNSHDDIVVNSRYVDLSLALLGPQGNSLALLNKLTRAINSTRGRHARVRKRGHDIDALALRISDAIIDASEM